MRSTRFSVLVAGLAAGAMLHAGPIHPVIDANPGTADGLVSILGKVDSGELIFFGRDPVNGVQLWRSDGTTAGTGVLAIVAGSQSGDYFFPPTAESSGMVWFAFNDGFFGRELWRSDGSAAGTIRVTDLAAGSASASIGALAPMPIGLAFGGSASAGAGPVLWQSNATPAGTTNQIPLYSFSTNDSDSAVVDTAILFSSNRDGAAPFRGLVRTLGTSATTTNVRAFAFAGVPQNLVAVNDRVFFSAGETATGRELWVSDGTTAGTLMVKDILPGSGDSSPANLTRVDDRVFFTAVETTGGRELYVSDGTAAGTMRVKDIRAGILDSSPDKLSAIYGTLYFAANDGVSGIEWWTSDGTEAGTRLLQDSNPGMLAGAGDTSHAAKGISRRAFFTADLGGNGATEDLFMHTSGAPTPTAVDSVFNSNGGVARMIPANGSLFLDARVFNGPGAAGRELYAIDLLAYAGPTWCESPEQPIADNTTTLSTFHLPPGAGTLTDLDIAIDLGHTQLGNLRITLRHEETARQVVLLDRPGVPATATGCAGDLLDIVLDSSAATPAEGSCANTRLGYPRDASFAPSESLAVFNGQPLSGTWTLTVEDLAAGDTGTLHEWCVIGTRQPTVDLIFTNSFE